VIEWVDDELKSWARWASQRIDSGLGYPNKTLEAEMIRMGGILISGSGAWSSPTNPRAEFVERCINKLGEKHREVVLVRYLTFGPPLEKAKQLHCSVKHYYHQVHKAHQRMEEIYFKLKTPLDAVGE